MPRTFHGWPHRAPTGRTAYVNGAYVPHAHAHVHIEDRGLQFSDAIYEVWGVSNCGLLDEDEHFERLERSLRELQMAMPMSREAFKLVLRELVRRNAGSTTAFSTCRSRAAPSAAITPSRKRRRVRASSSRRGASDPQDRSKTVAKRVCA